MMYRYIKGVVTDKGEDVIVLENNDIGYLIITPHPRNFIVGEYYLVYIHTQTKEDGTTLFGFTQEEELELFYRLINVKGVGPKTACSVLSGTDATSFINAINNGDINMLKKLPGIGLKSAQQLIVELRGKFSEIKKVIDDDNNLQLKDAREALLAMGIGARAIEEAFSSFRGENLTTKEYIKKALAFIYARK